MVGGKGLSFIMHTNIPINFFQASQSPGDEDNRDKHRKCAWMSSIVSLLGVACNWFPCGKEEGGEGVAEVGFSMSFN